MWSAKEARGRIRQVCSPLRTSTTGMVLSSVASARPTPNSRGCRSSATLFSSTSRAPGPSSTSTVRLAERSTACPGTPSSSASW